MEFQIGVSELKKAMRTVAKNISVRPEKSFMSNVLVTAFTNDGRNYVSFYTTNGISSIKKCLECDSVKECGQISLEAKKLQNIADKFNTGVAHFKSTAKSVTMKIGGSKANLVSFNVDDFPPSAEFETENKAEIQGLVLDNALRTIIYAANPNESRDVLTGCSVKFDGDKTVFAALDGFRIAKVEAECKSSIDGEISLPHSAIVALSTAGAEIKEGIAEIFTDSKRLLYKDETTEINTSLLAGKYPDYQTLIKSIDGETKSIFKTSEMLDAVNRSLVFGATLKMKFDKDQCLLKAVDKADNSEFTESIKCYTTGGQMDICFNGRYISEALQRIKGDETCFFFGKTNVQAAKLVDTEKIGDEHIVLPVRTF